MAVDVGFTPADVHQAATAVVVDVLRATSTIAQALACGYERVLCLGARERALELRGPDRVVASEEGGVRPPDFDLGNSPAEFTEPRARELVLATTNGSPAIVAAADAAEEVVLASLLNLDAVTAALPEDDVLILCSGTDGTTSLEDVYVAGRLTIRLGGKRTDAALVAERVAEGYPDARSALAASAHAQTLREVGLEGDLDWCARESVVGCVPRVSDVRDGVAIVEPRAPDETASAPGTSSATGGDVASAGRG